MSEQGIEIRLTRGEIEALLTEEPPMHAPDEEILDWQDERVRAERKLRDALSTQPTETDSS